MMILTTLNEIFERPKVEDMTFFEKKVYKSEDLLKLFIVRWYLMIPLYGFTIEIFK